MPEDRLGGSCLLPFRQQKLEEVDGQVGQHYFGQMRLEVAQAKAERIIREELRRLGWPEGQLATRRKRDPGKLEMATRLRKETTLSVKEIAARLHLGTRASASLCLLAALKKTTTQGPTQESKTQMQGRGLTPFLYNEDATTES